MAQVKVVLHDVGHAETPAPAAALTGFLARLRRLRLPLGKTAGRALEFFPHPRLALGFKGGWIISLASASPKAETRYRSRSMSLSGFLSSKNLSLFLSLGGFAPFPSLPDPGARSRSSAKRSTLPLSFFGSSCAR